ncbi:RHS repeat-associated core domain-containing protein [Photorhabdus hindustanensis]|uniref:RHS repeat-associated core domain-containing protein n=1 Tax=Photorhabdus hindustanensis TaxID=2918802 RepID=A0A2S8Q7T4_9GAMM|nr:RHS repeat-associated core domain-containing protein [Photorhabdus hindustanensis]PQQ28897.1 hypothetical protein C6H66_03185 [Photorhabdus hindustanensis]
MASPIYSSAFNESSYLSGQPDLRTGLFSKRFTLGSVVGNAGNGPSLALTLAFDPLTAWSDQAYTQSAGNYPEKPWGYGWTLSVPRYSFDSDSNSGQLSLLQGMSWVVLDGLTSGDKPLDGHLLLTLRVNIAQDGQTLTVTYANGTILTYTFSLDSSRLQDALLTSIRSANGRSLTVQYVPGSGELQSIIDDTGMVLCYVDSNGPCLGGNVLFYPVQNGTTWEADSNNPDSYVVTLTAQNALLTKVTYPESLIYTLTYQDLSPNNVHMYYLTQVVHATGMVENVEYLAQLPLPNPPAGYPTYIWGVTQYTQSPGVGTPDLVSTYTYGTGDSGIEGDNTGNNFFGYGAPNVSLTSNLDTLLHVTQAYCYTNQQKTVFDDSTTVVTTQTYDKFHSLLRKVVTRDDSVHTQTLNSSYGYVNESSDITGQDPRYKLPTQADATYQDNSVSPALFRTETTQLDWSENGQLVSKTDKAGTVTEFSYYSATGESDGDNQCPPDPNNFSLHIKDKVVTPAPVNTEQGILFDDAPISRMHYQYAVMPCYDNTELQYIVTTHQSQYYTVDSTESLYSDVKYAYYDSLDASDSALVYGRQKSVSTTLYDYSGAQPVSTVSQQIMTYVSGDSTQTPAPMLNYTGLVSTTTTLFAGELLQQTQSVTSTAGKSLRIVQNSHQPETCTTLDYQYDGLSRVVSEAAAINTSYAAIRTYKYNFAEFDANLSSIQTPATLLQTDAKNGQLKTLYDGAGHPIQTFLLDVDGVVAAPTDFYLVRRFSYNAGGSVISTTSIDYVPGDTSTNPSQSATTTRSYDVWGNVSAVTYSDGHQHITIQDPIFNTTFSYLQSSPDAQEQLRVQCTLTTSSFLGVPITTEMQNANGEHYAITTYAYDGVGNQRQVIDAQGNVTSTDYDVYQRPTVQIRPDFTQNVTQYAPSSTQALPITVGVRASENDGIVTLGERTFDGFNRIVTETVGGRITQYTYDDSGDLQPQKMITPVGDNITLNYQPRLMNVLLSAGPDPGGNFTPSAQYSYDDISGIMLTALLTDDVGNSNQATMTYFSSGQLKSERFDLTIESVPQPSKNTQYTYTLKGKLLTYTDVCGNTQTLHYDSLGRLNSCTQQMLAVDIAYNFFGQPEKVTAVDSDTGNTAILLLSNDTFGREKIRTFYTTVNGESNQQTLILSYNTLNQITQRELLRNTVSVRTETYIYTLLGQLGTYTCEGNEYPVDITGKAIYRQGFSFDLYGNVATLITDYSDSSSNTATYQYSDTDPTQLISISNVPNTEQDATFSYDGNGNMLTDEQGRQLTYNSLNQRTAIFENNGTLLARYAYDALGRQIALQPVEQPVRTFWYQGQTLVNEIQGNMQAACLLGLASLTNDGERWQAQLLGTDNQGSVIQITGSTSTNYRSYTPLGYTPKIGSSENLSVPDKGYIGQPTDPVSGDQLLGNGYRGYNPRIGCFMSQDRASPFGRGGFNGYEFDNGNPINNTDPSGRGPVVDLFEVLLGVTTEIAAAIVTGGAAIPEEAALDAGVIGAEVGADTGVEAAGEIGAMDAAGNVSGAVETSGLGEGTLENTKQKLYPVEENLAGWAQREGEATVTVVHKTSDLDVLSDTTRSHKFVFNQEGKLAIGSISKEVDPKMLSHPALAAIAGKSGVISAGYLHRAGNKIFLVNHSGHYRPSFERLVPVKGYIQNDLELKTYKIRANSLEHLLLKLIW